MAKSNYSVIKAKKEWIYFQGIFVSVIIWLKSALFREQWSSLSKLANWFLFKTKFKRLTGVRERKDGDVEYLVKWVGYTKPTWESEDNVQVI